MKLLIAMFLIAIPAASKAIPADAIRTTSVTDICGTKTKTIRHVTPKMSRFVYARDGVPGGNHTGRCAGPGGCELDHVVSLELGGSNALSNLTVQPYDGRCNAHDKDRLENRLHRMICAGEIRPDIAQDMIFNDWQLAFVKLVDARGCQ